LNYHGRTGLNSILCGEALLHGWLTGALVSQQIATKGKFFMVMFGGTILFLIGIASLISLLVYGYKEFKADESKTSKKAVFLVLGILDTFFVQVAN